MVGARSRVGVMVTPKVKPEAEITPRIKARAGNWGQGEEAGTRQGNRSRDEAWYVTGIGTRLGSRNEEQEPDKEAGAWSQRSG